jgi:hypothetical protein
MIFFLCTGFGDSNNYAGSTGGKKLRGMCKGNGATPAGWTVTSIAMIQAHKRKGHGVHLTCPISKTPLYLAGTLFVDDTDLEHFDMTKVEMVQEVHGALQNSFHNWGCILTATGEAPLKDGTLAAIKHLIVTAPTKTLGQMTCPTGSTNRAIAQMKDKVQGWIAKAQLSKLHKRNLWLLLDNQYWPRVSFRIGIICTPFAVRDEHLVMQTYFGMLSLCGICKLVSRDIRQMVRGLYGIGLPHMGVECFIAQINKLHALWQQLLPQQWS